MRESILILLVVVLCQSTHALLSPLDAIEYVSEQAGRLRGSGRKSSPNPASPIPRRPWQTRLGEEFKHDDLSHKVFGSFEKFLNPILEDVLHKHPDIRALRDQNKVELTHHMVPMRDGVKLSTIVINPLPAKSKKGTILSRSPYGPTSDQVADIYILLNGFAAVIQDQRGTFMSEGEFSMWHDDAHDGFDTMAWIEAQDWSNGEVFTVGISADGCGSAAAILAEPPQLKGQLIVWASMDGHETSFPGGVFREGLVTGWMTLMSIMTHGVSLTKTLPDIIDHEALSDWWSPIEGPGHYHQARFPTIHLSAWWDIFQGDHLRMFNGINDHAQGIDHFLFVGPLGHCLLDPILSIEDPMLTMQEAKGIAAAFAFSSEVFAGKTLDESKFKDKINKLNVYVQGSRTEGARGGAKVGHYWTSLENWPEPSIHRLLLNANHELTFEAPMLESDIAVRTRLASHKKATDKSGFVEFNYDPRFPMITDGGNNLILIFMGMGCGSKDQRVTESRKDVAVFTTREPLEEPLALMGNLRAVLYVSTNRPDTDFYVSVTDVHPDGSSMQIRYGTRRMKWRESTQFRSVLSETEGGIVYKLEVDLWFTSYVLAPGHKLRVLVGSANTPYYAKNDNSGEDPLGFKHELPAVNRVYWSDEYPSHIELPVVDLKDIPENKNFGL